MKKYSHLSRKQKEIVDAHIRNYGELLQDSLLLDTQLKMPEDVAQNEAADQLALWRRSFALDADIATAKYELHNILCKYLGCDHPLAEGLYPSEKESKRKDGKKKGGVGIEGMVAGMVPFMIILQLEDMAKQVSEKK